MRVIGVYRVWVSIDSDGCFWMSIGVWGVYGCLYLAIGANGCLEVYGGLWMSRGIWVFMGFYI